MSVKDRVTDIISQQMGVPIEEITPDCTYESLGVDSLDLFELVLEMEEEFDIVIPDDNVRNLFTVDETIKFITQLSA